MSDQHPELLEAIRVTHGCDSRWLESVPVREEFQGRVVWEGRVEVFELLDHPVATKAYAWAQPAKGGKVRYVAVLHVPPVDSPLAAVRAAIVAETRAAKD